MFIQIGSRSFAAIDILLFAELVVSLVLICKSIKRSKTGGWLYLLSILALVFWLSNDVFYFTDFYAEEIFNFFAFLFLLIQMFIQTMRVREFHEAKAASELKFLRA